jgi:hypothetical protein
MITNENQILKTCSKCKLKLPANTKYFYKQKWKDGLNTICKTCSSVTRKEYKRTKEGLIANIYGHQKYREKNLNITVEYSKQELLEYLLDNKIFDKLFNNWKKSNYNINLTPSVDRLNDYDNYSFNNIQIITWIENKEKGNKDRYEGINNKGSKEISQYDLNNNFIKKYFSQSIAARELNLKQSEISKSCITGKSYKNYIFKFNNG